jgi:hypothetical protein
MKGFFLDLLDPSNDPEFFWQVISGPPCIFENRLDYACYIRFCGALCDETTLKTIKVGFINVRMRLPFV